MTCLPRLRTSVKPCISGIRHASRPESVRNIANGYFNVGDVELSFRATLNLLRRRRLKEEHQSFFKIRAGFHNGVTLAGYVDFGTWRHIACSFTLDNRRQSSIHRLPS